MTKNRQRTIKIRVTEDEHQSLQEKCLNQQLAKWMRETCLDQRVTRYRRYTKTDPTLLRELVAIGNNLNQITRAINRENWDPVNRMMVAVQLEGIEKQLRKIQLGE